MENKKSMTNEEMEAFLERSRKKENAAKVVIYIGGAGMCLTIMLGMIPIALLCILVALIGAVICAKYSAEIKEALSDHIISGVLTETLGDQVQYNPTGRVTPGHMVFPFPYTKTVGSDHIRAVYKGLNIELSDIELINEEIDMDAEGNTETSKATFFKGQWLICDFGKELSGEVYLSERSKKDRSIMKSDVTMENKAFAKRFCVKAEIPQEAYYILTPHVMEYITRMADRSGGTVYMSFLRDGRMHVAVKTRRDLFELGRSGADVEGLRRKFCDELKWFTDIVDTLRVEDTLYKKETNA